MTKMHVLFGRITGEQPECERILKKFFLPNDCLACMENADDGCSRTHCHFIARTDKYKNMKTLRQCLADLCKKVFQEALRYSVKDYDEDKDGEAYICKGHKTDASVAPRIFINTYGIDVQESYDRFHKTAADIKQSKHAKAVWKEVVLYIEKQNPKFFQQTFTPATQIHIAGYLYDYYISKERMIQGKFVQQMILSTIIANKFNSKTLKKSFVQTWTSDLQYWNGLEMAYSSEITDAFEDL